MTKPMTGFIYRSDAKINSASTYAIGDLIKNSTREPKKVLATVWEKARDALLHTAMGIGARHWISETDCEILMSAWNKTVNVDEYKS